MLEFHYDFFVKGWEKGLKYSIDWLIRWFCQGIYDIYL